MIVFGEDSHANLYWQACKALLEQHFGKVVIDAPLKGGYMTADFAAHTGVIADYPQMDASALRVLQGRGKTKPLAVMDLFKQATSIQLLEYIATHANDLPDGRKEYRLFEYDGRGGFRETPRKIMTATAAPQVTAAVA